ncbi:MAG: cysteine hydrolase [Lachnospiraceae bacterium]|nr:cysteine hydrolase [Lachnospiraceae bacterium]
MKVLVVVDMQQDFINGALGTKEAVSIVPAVRRKIEGFDGMVLFTKDTHHKDYLQTQEGRNLPVIHCVKGSEGHELEPSLAEYARQAAEEKQIQFFEKPGFGSKELAQFLEELSERESLEQIELVGLCTDICVISNAMLLKTFLPEVPVIVDSACCAGVTPQSHMQALEAMKMCQIQVISS